MGIGFTIIFGRPLFIYFGILAFLSMMSAAIVAVGIMKGKLRISFKWHHRLAGAAIVFAIIHVLLVFI